MKDLTDAVLEWWEEHQYDVDVAMDGEYAEEYERYGEEPEFVKIAKKLKD